MASPIAAAPNNPVLNDNQVNPNTIRAEQLWNGIKKVAKVAFAIFLTAALFMINPGISLISFVVGVAFNDVVSKAVNKITKFISEHRIIAILAAIATAVLVLPVFIATVTVIWNAYLGSYLSGN